MRQYAIPSQCTPAPQPVAPAYALPGLPVTALIDWRGIVRHRFVGPVMLGALEGALQSWLK
jgi:hypothetical protein